MKTDDEDIKIFRPEKKDGAGAELAALAELLDAYRNNGNMEKAARLGESLAERIVPEKLFPERIKKLNADELFQLWALTIFSARLSLRKYAPHPMLASQSINAMRAKIDRENPESFAKLSEDSAFTFYYLSVRKNKNVAEDVGSSFAMLCGREGDEYFVSLGKKAFLRADTEVREAVDEIKFKE